MLQHSDTSPGYEPDPAPHEDHVNTITQYNHTSLHASRGSDESSLRISIHSNPGVQPPPTTRGGTVLGYHPSTPNPPGKTMTGGVTAPHPHHSNALYHAGATPLERKDPYSQQDAQGGPVLAPTPRPGFFNDFAEGLLTPRLQKHFSYQPDDSSSSTQVPHHSEPPSFTTTTTISDGTAPRVQSDNSPSHVSDSHHTVVPHDHHHSHSNEEHRSSASLPPCPPTKGDASHHLSPDANISSPIQDITTVVNPPDSGYASNTIQPTNNNDEDIDIPDIKVQFQEILHQTRCLALTLDGSIKRSFDCANILNEISTKQLEYIESTLETLTDEIGFAKNIFITLQIKAFQLQQLLASLPEMVHEIHSILQMLPALEARVATVVKNVRLGKMKFIPPQPNPSLLPLGDEETNINTLK